MYIAEGITIPVPVGRASCPTHNPYDVRKRAESRDSEDTPSTVRFL